MRLLLSAVGVWLGFMAIIGGWCWVFSRRRRRSTVVDSPVSPRWLNEHAYERDHGDEP